MSTVRPRVVPVRHYGQWIAVTLVIILAAKLVYDVATQSTIRWEIIGARLFAEPILQGVGMTIVLTIVSMILGVIGGVVVAIMRLSNNPVLRYTSGLFVWIFRGTPILVQILIWFNLALFFPTIGLFGFQADTNSLISPLLAAILGLTLNECAYVSEIVRGGIQSVDKGQVEASQALGMKQAQIMGRIVLPQAMRAILPPLGNETVTLLKETSLVAVIGAGDLLTRAQQIGAADFSRMEMLIVASIWYLALTTVATAFQWWLERRFDPSGTQAAGLPGFLKLFVRMRPTATPRGGETNV
ncbi:amino acid ABC transporter permease [Microbacterium sp.]|uniref:amino acid ABC transporter permease n=1 Tax=Microbacterium sp. TaxID=51671 RepID=UPI003C738A91